MTNCILKIGSVTQANKARNELAKHSIYVKIRKLTEQKQGGCIHGIEFNCINKTVIMRILLRAEINFEEYKQ